MWAAYNIFLWFYALIALPVFAAKGKFGSGASSRFGNIPFSVRERLSGRSVWWIHGVSVGEISLAVRFADKLRARMPEAKILLTTTTVQGHEVALKIKNEEDELLYFPVDLDFCVKRFVRQTNPCALILFETELWPNLIRELAGRSAPVFLVNGRISDRAFPSYRRVRFFLKNVFSMFSMISAQDERMRARFVELGAEPHKVSAEGNMKYDWEPSHLQSELATPLKRALKSSRSFLFIAGSTHEGEEEMLLKMASELIRKFPGFRMLIAPRHLTRMALIEKTAERAGIAIAKVSLAALPTAEDLTAKSVFLLDQVGVLAPLYEAADLVFIGGSLVRTGGHNLVEPAVYAKPILFGPYMDNFFEMAEEFRLGQAAVRVGDAEALKNEIERLIPDKGRLESLGRAAQALARRHQGAAEKNLEKVLSVLESKERSFVRS